MLAIKELEQRFKGRHANPKSMKAVHDERTTPIRTWILAVCENNIHTALFLAQIMFLAKISQKNGKEWFYKEAKEWKEELGLSRWHLEQARKFCIAAGFLEEKRKRLEHKNACVMHYKVNLTAIKRALEIITLTKEEDGTLQELLERKGRTAERKQKQQNHRENRTKLVARASTQMKFKEKAQELERMAKHASHQPFKPKEPQEVNRQQNFTPNLRLLMRNPALNNRMQELMKEGLKPQEAYERALLEKVK